MVFCKLVIFCFVMCKLPWYCCFVNKTIAFFDMKL